MKTITLQMLKDKKASKSCLVTFKEVFGDEVKLTAGNFKKAINARLNIYFCTCFLSPQAWAEYDKVRSTAWAEYDKVRSTALAEYSKVRSTAWAEYSKVCSTELLKLLKAEK